MIDPLADTRREMMGPWSMYAKGEKMVSLLKGLREEFSSSEVPIFYGRLPTGRPADPDEHYTAKYIDLPVEPLFPFGHGLSYSRFAPSSLRVGSAELVSGSAAHGRGRCDEPGSARRRDDDADVHPRPGGLVVHMGIALRDQSGNLRRSEDLLGDVADAFARIEDPAERVRLAFKRFDFEGVAPVNLLAIRAARPRTISRSAAGGDATGLGVDMGQK